MVLRSSLLAAVPGITHAFTTREGGCSSGPNATLNLGLNTNDDPENVHKNRQRVLQQIGLSGHWFSPNQVHGCGCVRVEENTEPCCADAVWTDRSDVAVAVTVADCVPILVASRDGKVVAAIHAGWRGTESHVAGKLVACLWNEAGVAAENLIAAIGPCIGARRFCVGAEVAHALRQAYPSCHGAFEDCGDEHRADLQALNRASLVQSGLPPSNIDSIEVCTFDDTRFFSYRRDGGTTGRQAAVIGRIG